MVGPILVCLFYTALPTSFKLACPSFVRVEIRYDLRCPLYSALMRRLIYVKVYHWGLKMNLSINSVIALSANENVCFRVWSYDICTLVSYQRPSPSLSLLRSSSRTKERYARIQDDYAHHPALRILRGRDTPESGTSWRHSIPRRTSNTIYSTTILFCNLYWHLGVACLEKKVFDHLFTDITPARPIGCNFSPMQIPTCKWAEFLAMYIILSLKRYFTTFDTLKRTA